MRRIFTLTLVRVMCQTIRSGPLRAGARQLHSVKETPCDELPTVRSTADPKYAKLPTVRRSGDG